MTRKDPSESVHNIIKSVLVIIDLVQRVSMRCVFYQQADEREGRTEWFE